MVVGDRYCSPSLGFSSGCQGVAAASTAGVLVMSGVLTDEGMAPLLCRDSRAQESPLPWLYPAWVPGGMELRLAGLSLAPPLGGGTWHTLRCSTGRPSSPLSSAPSLSSSTRVLLSSHRT